MAYICYNCGKGSNYGTQHRHKPGVAGRQHYRRAPHTPKRFKPNLQTAYMLISGHSQKILLCTKCRRTFKDAGLIKVWTKETAKAAEVKSAKITKEATLKIEPKQVEKKPVEKTSEKPAKKTRKSTKVKTEVKEPAVPTISIEDLVGKKK